MLDGTGSRQWLTRSLGVEVTHHSPRRIVCYGYAEGEFPGDSWPELHCTTSGWTWRAVISSSRLAWARLSFAKNSKLLAPPSELFGAGKPIGAIRAADATWRIAKTLAGPGWLLLGDAAAQLDPAAGHGVLRALMSGIMAAHLILKASPEDAALAYDQWLRAWFAEDVTRLNQLYREMHASEFEPHPSVGSLTSNIETPQPPHETQRLCSQVNI